VLLAIDVGNTQTVLGLVDHAARRQPGAPAAGDGAGSASRVEVVEHWRVATDERRTCDEWVVLFEGLLARHPDVDDEVVDGLAICSTVPAVLHEMREMAARHYTGVPAVIVEPGVRTGIAVLMDNPREVGTDRILNALAAFQLHGGPAIVVDFGTATTFDVVSAKGEYVGGAIAPGIGISLDALGERGAQLRKVELARPRSVIAKNTVEALQSGVLYGFAGQVDGVVTRMVAELGRTLDEVTVVATGGLATLVLDESATIDVHEPWLTLVGLWLVWERNQPR
jgi:type III pantothenate kinase